MMEDLDPCADLVLLKQGLDLRLEGLLSEHKRILSTQKELDQKYNELVLESALSFEHDLNSYTKKLNRTISSSES